MTHLNKLRWQCRRGTKELDFLLLQYIDHRYLLADTHEQAQFLTLLNKEDDWLLGVLLGELDAGEMSELVGKIKK